MEAITIQITAKLVNLNPGQETPRWELVPERGSLVFKPEGLSLKAKCDLILGVANSMEVYRTALVNRAKGHEVPAWSTWKKLHL